MTDQNHFFVHSYSALASYLCSPDVKREMQRAFFLIFKLKTRKSKSITAKVHVF
jgi:hypothetical protein